MPERPDYENEKKEYYIYMRVEPVSFGKEHKDMLGHCKMLLDQGYVAINPAFDKLITSLRTAVAEENILDKESTSYTEIFEAYRLALKRVSSCPLLKIKTLSFSIYSNSVD